MICNVHAAGRCFRGQFKAFVYFGWLPGIITSRMVSVGLCLLLVLQWVGQALPLHLHDGDSMFVWEYHARRSKLSDVLLMEHDCRRFKDSMYAGHAFYMQT